MGQPKFFCENCKKEVSARDKICPHCGRFFSEVRCPRCNFIGQGTLFLNGCPKCGYLKDSFGSGGADSGDLEYVALENFVTHGGGKKKKNSFPPWVFFALTLGLATILAVLVYFYLTL